MNEQERERHNWEREVHASYSTIETLAKHHRVSVRRLRREYETALAVLVCTVGKCAADERYLFRQLYDQWIRRKR